MIINDPDGTAAQVNDENELVTRSITETELEHASSKGTAYCWDSGERDIDATDTMLYIRNDSDTPLILDNASFSGSNVICTWEIYIGATTTAPTGTTVTGVNINQTFSSKLAEATASYDEGAVADGSVIGRVKTAISGHLDHNLDGVILGKNHYIQINQLTESTSGSVVVKGHYTNPS